MHRNSDADDEAGVANNATGRLGKVNIPKASQLFFATQHAGFRMVGLLRRIVNNTFAEDHGITNHLLKSDLNLM